MRHILAVNAEQLMTEDLTTVSPEDTLEHVAGLMIKLGHSSLPVVENGKLAGHHHPHRSGPHHRAVRSTGLAAITTYVADATSSVSCILPRELHV
ncbi:MAG: CBS domain-containing protein [Caldilineaceae bacterium]